MKSSLITQCFESLRYSKIILLLTLGVAISGCNSLRKLQLMKAGSTEHQNYLTVIDFESRADLPFVQATINGHTGWFLFDTGAPNVLDRDFAERLQLKSKAKGNVSDSGGNSLPSQTYVRLDKVNLGGILFQNTGAIIQDLSNSPIMECLDMDGIIGANLMRLAKWKIDYSTHEIHFSDRLSSLQVPSGSYKIPFSSQAQGTPLVNLSLNNIKVSNITFDTGSNGDLTLPTTAFKALRTDLPSTESAFSIGSTTYGVGGKALSDTSFYTMVDSLSIGGLHLADYVVKYRTHGGTLGYDFLQHYQIFMDFDQKLIFLAPQESPHDSKLEEFGFEIDFRKDGLYIGGLYAQSEAFAKLKIDDKILAIEEKDFREMRHEELCDQIKHRKISLEGKEQIDIELLRDGKTIKYHLQRQDLLSPND